MHKNLKFLHDLVRRYPDHQELVIVVEFKIMPEDQKALRHMAIQDLKEQGVEEGRDPYFEQIVEMTMNQRLAVAEAMKIGQASNFARYGIRTTNLMPGDNRMIMCGKVFQWRALLADVDEMHPETKDYLNAVQFSYNGALPPLPELQAVPAG